MIISFAFSFLSEHHMLEACDRQVLIDRLEICCHGHRAVFDKALIE